MIFFCLDIPNAKKMKHERIIGSKQRDPVIDSDRCIQHVIIQVGVSAVCHRRIHRTSCYFRFWGAVSVCKRFGQAVKMIERIHRNFRKFCVSFFCRNICFLYPVFLSGSCNIHTDRGSQYEQIDEQFYPGKNAGIFKHLQNKVLFPVFVSGKIKTEYQVRSKSTETELD